MSWRLCYSEQDIKMTAINPNGLVVQDKLIVAPCKMELRDPLGQIVRMMPGSEFILKNTHLGIRPEYYGKIGILRKGNCGKYRTSCWLTTYPSAEPADILVQKGAIDNTDDIFVFLGALAITEFDDKNTPYGICFVKQGSKVTLEYDTSKNNEERYHVAGRSNITNEEYDLFINEIYDPRKWK